MIVTEPRVENEPYRFKLVDFLMVTAGFTILLGHFGKLPLLAASLLGVAMAAFIEMGAKTARTRLIELDRQAFLDDLAPRTHLYLHAASCGACTELEPLCAMGKEMARLDEAEDNVVIGTEQEIFLTALERELGAHALSETGGQEVVVGYRNDGGVTMVRLSFRKDGRFRLMTLERT